jgi:hypothetical protein
MFGMKEVSGQRPFWWRPSITASMASPGVDVEVETQPWFEDTLSIGHIMSATVSIILFDTS